MGINFLYFMEGYCCSDLPIGITVVVDVGSGRHFIFNEPLFADCALQCGHWVIVVLVRGKESNVLTSVFDLLGVVALVVSVDAGSGIELGKRGQGVVPFLRKTSFYFQKSAERTVTVTN
jgi:hypothetical protein